MLVGLKYDVKVWRELWPRIMRNTIEACKRANARLVFFDNVYMYGRVDGSMTEETPFNPCSAKGEIRARIAADLLYEMRAGMLTAIIARAADFYGPAAGNGIPNVMVFDKLARGSRAMCLVDDSVPHSYTFTPDAAKSMVLLTESDTAWNQTWHVPTATDPPAGRQLVEMAAKELGTRARYRVLSKPMLKIAGWFDGTVRELYEMLYQNGDPYPFDSTKFAKAFGFEATSYPSGVRLTSASYH